ncbi:MAG: reverse transcriptase [Cupriavidus sp.]|nr:reverse transcriptase [Cupriavidus sp.]QWE95942.1 RNA-directed DNA polymerase [Cupriavidus sp. EM10]MCA3196745.1 reverse transcriptase [Cupriavidus sp.]MCA3203324.1 reverse transcriptase [Cupriavidus sp.]MCA3209965.1 reverse transcriptase [Cupriavidus sp.]
MTERSFNLVAPLAHEATAMRTTETTRHDANRSGAVSQLSNRLGDVDSATLPAGLGIRTSTTATRTTTTRTTSFAPEPSAGWNESAPFSFLELVEAYIDCRRTKRSSASALAFEFNLERNLRSLFDELTGGGYTPGRSKCFVITRPKPREVWAAEFRDRIVHHLLYNRIGPQFELAFIADTCACIKGRGTLYAARRLDAKVRSITQNWSRPAHYLKCDLANFFVSIDKNVLRELLFAKIREPFWRSLTELVLMHDPRENFVYRGDPAMLTMVPPHKRLMEQPSHLGLPIGNLSSQFFANVYLDVLDQHVKHQVGARHYIRYVDDFVLLHESPQWLNGAHDDIAAFLPRALGARLNPSKTILQPVDRGIDFVGQVIRPWVRTTRPRTVEQATRRLRQMPADEVYAATNSYLGLVRQATGGHDNQAQIANIARRRGHSVKSDLTKVYRRKDVA